MEENGSRKGSGSKALRRQVLGVVYDLVSKRGIEETGVRAIAEAANVSTGTINYHFSNKHTLLMEAYEAAYQLPDDWEQYSGAPSTQLRRLVGGYVFRSMSDRFWRFWINYTALSTRDEDMRHRQDRRYERQKIFWSKLISDGVAAGVYRKDLDCDREAERLLLIAHGLIVRQILSPEPATRELARRVLDEELEALCRRQPGERNGRSTGKGPSRAGPTAAG